MKQLNLEDAKPKERTINLPAYPINDFTARETPVCMRMFMAVSDEVGQGLDKIDVFRERVHRIMLRVDPCPEERSCEKCPVGPRQLILGEDNASKDES